MKVMISAVFLAACIVSHCAKPDQAPPATPDSINFFEIPVKNLDRAQTFYSTVLANRLERMEIAGQKMSMFPMGKTAVSGALVQAEGYVPSTEGSLVYLNANPDLSPALARVEAAGGKILLPKTEISPEAGYFALLLDTEGNKVALHSMK